MEWDRLIFLMVTHFKEDLKTELKMEKEFITIKKVKSTFYKKIYNSG